MAAHQRAFAALLLAALTGCGATVTSHYDQYGSRQLVVSCVDNRELCDSKAKEICPQGYRLLNEHPPTGLGFYYANHFNPTTANEDMAYSMTIACK